MSYQIYLSHHGIGGQQWGVRHGPPYPLRSTVSTGSILKKKVASTIAAHKEKKAQKEAEAKAEAERRKEEERTQVLNSGSPNDILKRQNEFSTDELQAAITRIEKVQKLVSQAESEKTQAKLRLDSVNDQINDVSKYITTAVDLYKNVSAIKDIYDQQKKAELAQKAAALVNSDNAAEMLRRKRELSTDDIKAALERLSKLEQLEQQAQKQSNTPRPKPKP